MKICFFENFHTWPYLVEFPKVVIMVNCGVPHHVLIVSALSFTDLFDLGSTYCVAALPWLDGALFQLENEFQCYLLSTVPTTPVWTKPALFTNWPNFTMLFYYIKLPPQSSLPGSTLALTEALNWGTVWTSISTDKENTKGQS